MARGPGPALKYGVPLLLMGAAGYFAWQKVIKPKMAQGEKKQILDTTTGISGKGSFKHTIRVAGDPWSGYSTFRKEPRLERALASKDIGLKYLDDEKYFDQNERMRALATGEIDIAVTTLDAFLQHGAKHKGGPGLYPGVIIFNIDESNGGDAIFLAKNLKSFDEVQNGMKVCYAAGTPSEHLFDFASLSFTSLAQGLVVDSGVVAADCWEKLKAGQVQVAVLWEPVTTLAERAGYRKVFATGGRADDIILDIAVANRDFLAKNGDVVEELVGAYFEVIKYYSSQSGQAEHARFIAQDCGKDCEGAADLGDAVLRGIDFLTYDENMCLWWGHCEVPAKMLERIQKTGKLLIAKSKLEASALPEPTTILTDRYLVAVKKKLEEKRKLAAEVAGAGTEVEPVIKKVEEKTYAYDAQASKEKAAADVGTLKIPNIYFQEGKADLDPNGQAVVASIADKLRSFPALCIKVYGHTNSRGDAKANQILSERRAQSIQQVMTLMDGKAFPAARFDARGFGEEKLVTKEVEGKMVEDLDASRRTEFTLFECTSS